MSGKILGFRVFTFLALGSLGLDRNEGVDSYSSPYIFI